jgi:hypothetical protein
MENFSALGNASNQEQFPSPAILFASMSALYPGRNSTVTNNFAILSELPK